MFYVNYHELPNCFHSVCTPFNISTSNARAPISPHPSTLVIFPGGYGVAMSYSGFNFQFLMTYDVEHLFHIFQANAYLDPCAHF